MSFGGLWRAHHSTGFPPATEVFPDALQLLIEQRVRAERTVRDLGDLLGLLPVALELVHLRTFVHRHFEGEAPFDTQAAQRDLATGDVADELVGAAGAFDQSGSVLDTLPFAAGKREIGESL